MVIFILFNTVPLAVDLIITFLSVVPLKFRLFPLPLMVIFSFVMLKSLFKFISLVIFTIEFGTSIAFFNSSKVSTSTSCFLYLVVVVVVVASLLLLVDTSRYFLFVSFIVLSFSLLLLIFKISAASFLWIFSPSSVRVEPFLTLIPPYLWFSLVISFIVTVAPAKSIPTVLVLAVPANFIFSKVTFVALSTANPSWV